MRLHICDQEPRDYLITNATSVAVRDLLVFPLFRPATNIVKIGLVQSVKTAVSSSQRYLLKVYLLHGPHSDLLHLLSGEASRLLEKAYVDRIAAQQAYI